MTKCQNLNGVCLLNLTAIANHGIPSGKGRKGGVAKRKGSRKIPTIETRSIRPCVQKSQPPTTITQTLSSSCRNVVVSPCVGAPLNASLTSVSGNFGMSHPPLPHLSNQASSHSSVTVAPHVNTSLNTIRDSGSTVAPRVGFPNVPRASGLQSSLMQHLVCTTSNNPCVSNASASSLGQVVGGGNVINFAAPPSSYSYCLSGNTLSY